MKVSIIIPAHNEEKRIGKTLEEYSNFFEKVSKKQNLDYEILVVINNTKDKTAEIVRGFRKKNSKIRYLNFERGGKGFAITEGFKEALKRKNDLIGFVDADLATAPEEYYKLIRNIYGYDGVIADRYIKGSKITPKYSFRRIIVSRIFNFFVRSLFLFSYRDTQCGAKLFKREAIEKMIKHLTITQWAYDIDLLYSAKINKFRIKSIPTVWYEKEGSKLNIKKASIQMFFAVIQLRIMHSPLKKFLKPIGSVIEIVYQGIKGEN